VINSQLLKRDKDGTIKFAAVVALKAKANLNIVVCERNQLFSYAEFLL
jgi:hypothetical protein